MKKISFRVWKKSIILVGVIIGLGALVYFALNYRIGADQQAGEKFNEGIAPLALEAKTQIKTTVQGSKYRFSYLGEKNEATVYFIDVDNLEVRERGMIKISLETLDGRVEPVIKSKPYFRDTQGQVVNSEIRSALVSHKLRGDSLELVFRDNLAGSSNLQIKSRKIVITPLGKTLKISSDTLETGDSVPLNNYAGLSVGLVSAGSRTINIPYMPNVPVFLKGDRFTSAFIDSTKSNSTFMFEETPENLSNPEKAVEFNFNKTRFASYPSSTFYEETAPGRTNPFKETFYLTVSQNITDHFPATQNQVSAYREQIGKFASINYWVIGNFLENFDGTAEETLPFDLGEFGKKGEKIKPLVEFQYQQAFLEILKKYSLDNLIVKSHAWQKTPRSDLPPEQFPIELNYGSDAQYKGMIAKSKEQGYIFTNHLLWTYLQDSSPLNQLLSSYVSKKTNGKPKKKSDFGDSLSPSGYFKAAERINPQTGKTLIAELAGLGISGAFLDTSAAYAPYRLGEVSALDKDASTLKQTVALNKKFFDYLKTNLRGPLIGEGGKGVDRFDSYYAGYMEAVEREADDPYGAIIPDYELNVVKAKMVGLGMGQVSRWACRGQSVEIDPTTKQSGECEDGFAAYNWDRYRAQTITYGHAISLRGPTHPEIRKKLDPQVKALDKFINTSRYYIKEYFLTQKLQELYSNSPISSISYYDSSGLIGTLSQTLREKTDYDFRNSRIKLNYANGTVVFVNNSQNSNWEIDLDGKKEVLPPNGFFAFNKSVPGWKGSDYFKAGHVLMKNSAPAYFSVSDDYLFVEGENYLVLPNNEIATHNLWVVRSDGTRIFCDNGKMCSTESGSTASPTPTAGLSHAPTSSPFPPDSSASVQANSQAQTSARAVRRVVYAPVEGVKKYVAASDIRSGISAIAYIILGFTSIVGVLIAVYLSSQNRSQ